MPPQPSRLRGHSLNFFLEKIPQKACPIQIFPYLCNRVLAKKLQPSLSVWDACKKFATFPGCQGAFAKNLQPSLSVWDTCKKFATFPGCQGRLQKNCSLP